MKWIHVTAPPANLILLQFQNSIANKDSNSRNQFYVFLSQRIFHFSLKLLFVHIKCLAFYYYFEGGFFHFILGDFTYIQRKRSKEFSGKRKVKMPNEPRVSTKLHRKVPINFVKYFFSSNEKQ